MTTINGHASSTDAVVRSSAPAPFVGELPSQFAGLQSISLSHLFGDIVLFIAFVGSFGGINLPPRQVAVITVFFAGLCFFLSYRGTVQRVHLPMFITGFLVLFTLSFFWTRNIFAWGDLFFSGVVPAIAVVAALACMPTSAARRSLVTLSVVMLIYTLVYTALNFSSSTTNIDYLTGFNTPGWRGSFVHKNSFATFGTVATAIMLNLPKRTWVKVAGTSAWVILLLLSRAVTGIIGLLAVFGAVLIAHGLRTSLRRHRLGYMAVTTAFGGALGLSAFLFAPRFADLFGKDSTLSGRTKIWEGAADLIVREPIFGYGGGGLWANQAIEPTRTLVRSLGFTVFHAHNGFIEVLLQLGLVGLILWIMSSIAVIARAARCIDVDRGFVTCTFGIVTAFLVMSISEALVFGPWPILLLVLSTLAKRIVSEGGLNDASRHIKKL
jgi:exopolysaccharide production protein ExoQ